MGYRCDDCGNEEKFYAFASVKQQGVDALKIGGDGQILEVLDTEIDDVDRDDDLYEIECAECESYNIDEEAIIGERDIPKTLKNLLED